MGTVTLGGGRRSAQRGAGANAALSVACLALVLLPTGPLRWLAGALLVLVLPGDAVRRLLGVLDGVAAFVVIVGGSLAVTVVVGLAAAAVGAGVTATSMAVGLAIAAVGADLAAARGGAWTEPAPPADGPRRRRAARLLAGYGVGVVAFALLTTQAVALSVRSETHDGSPAGTALSMTQSGRSAVVEVDAEASGTHPYELAVRGPKRSLLRTTLVLRQGDHRSVTVPLDGLSAGARVTATLTRAGERVPLRTVWLVVGTAGAAAR